MFMNGIMGICFNLDFKCFTQIFKSSFPKSTLKKPYFDRKRWLCRAQTQPANNPTDILQRWPVTIKTINLAFILIGCFIWKPCVTAICSWHLPTEKDRHLRVWNIWCFMVFTIIKTFCSEDLTACQLLCRRASLGSMSIGSIKLANSSQTWGSASQTTALSSVPFHVSHRAAQDSCEQIDSHIICSCVSSDQLKVAEMQGTTVYLVYINILRAYTRTYTEVFVYVCRQKHTQQFTSLNF